MGAIAHPLLLRDCPGGGPWGPTLWELGLGEGQPWVRDEWKQDLEPRGKPHRFQLGPCLPTCPIGLQQGSPCQVRRERTGDAEAAG